MPRRPTLWRTWGALALMVSIAAPMANRTLAEEPFYSPYPPAGVGGPIPMQDYVPDVSRGSAPTTGTSSGQRQSRSPTAAKPPVRRGSGTPPDQLTTPLPPATPRTPIQPAPPGSEAATAKFKRDLMQPELDRLQNQNALGRLNPTQQRDLFQRQHDLDKLQR